MDLNGREPKRRGTSRTLRAKCPPWRARVQGAMMAHATPMRASKPSPPTPGASASARALLLVASLACCVALLLLDDLGWAYWTLSGIASGLLLSTMSPPGPGFRGMAIAASLLAAALAAGWVREHQAMAVGLSAAPLLGALAGALFLRVRLPISGPRNRSGLPQALVALLVPAAAWLGMQALGATDAIGHRFEFAAGIAAGALAALVFATTCCVDDDGKLTGAGADASRDASAPQWLPTVACTLVLAALPWLPALAMPLAALPLLIAAPRAAPRAIGACALMLVVGWALLAWSGVIGDRGSIALAALASAVAHTVALAIARANGGANGDARLVARLRDELRAVLAHGPAPAAVLDQDLRHVSANAAYVRWLGEAAPAVERRSLGDVHGIDADALLAAARRTLAGQPQRAQLERADGRALDIHLEPRFSAEGPVDGVYLLAQDASWRAALDAQLDTLLDSLPSATLALDASMRIRHGNAPARALLGLADGEAWPPSLPGRLDAASAAALVEGVQHVREQRVAWVVAGDASLRASQAAGASSVPVGLRLAPLASDRGIVALLTLEDLASMRAREHALAEGRTQAEVAIDAIAEAVVACDARGVIVLFNPAASRLSGWPRETALGRPLDDVLALTEPGSDAPAPADIGPILAGRPVPPARRKWLLRGDGERVMVNESAAAVYDRFGQVCGVVLLLHDVTESQAQAQTLAHQAQHDPLTGLPNRVLLQDRLSQAIAQLDRGYRGALLYVDLDRFKPINDSLGHPVGDRVLQEIAARLRAGVRQDDTVSRQGGDEFVLLLVRLADPRDAARVADKLIHAIEAPMFIDGHELRVSASIGIALFPQDGRDIAGLTRQADSALYHAKQAGRGRYSYVTDIIGASADERMRIEHDIRIALASGGFELAWQPQVGLPDGQLQGVEALVRWRMGDGSLAAAQTFIPVAEETGLVTEIDEWVIRQACRQVVQWRADGLPCPAVSVNVSLARFDAERLLGHVASVLAETGLPPASLEMEFRGAQLFALGARGQALLAALRLLGVRVAADDFGSGQASLRDLAEFGLDTLKIDQDYVRGLQEGGTARTIIEAVLALGQVMGYQVVAKGIEDDAQVALLAELGCRHAQGTLLGQAGSATDFANVLGANPADTH